MAKRRVGTARFTSRSTAAEKSSTDNGAGSGPRPFRSAFEEANTKSMSSKITMYLGSMDHSPSEQLGEPDDWHTTVLILSEAGQHFDAAKDVASRLGCRNGLLRKWSKKPSYRQNGTFGAALADALPRHDIFVRVICAQARTISQSYRHMIEQLGLNGLVESFSKNEKPYLRFGPFTRVTPEGDFRACIFRHYRTTSGFSHFHLSLLASYAPTTYANRNEATAGDRWVDWQLMPNKFPGDVTGPMASLFMQSCQAPHVSD